MGNTSFRSRLQAFLTYLQKENLCDRQTLLDVVKFRDSLDRRLVNLATVKGYVNPADLLDAMASQMDSELPLGEHLIKKGLLTREQHDELIEMQNPNSLRLFRECLLLTDAMKPDVVDRALQSYQQIAPEAPPASDEPAAPETPSRRSAEEVKAVLRKITRVFTLPTIVQKILSILDEPGSDLSDAAKLIESDPSITSQVLRMVNSAMFGLRSKITGVRQALVALGTRGTRRLILTTVVAGSFIKLEKDKGRALWTHSIRSAYWCRELVARKNKNLQDDAFTAGILHEIGSVILHQIYAKEMNEIQTRVDGGASRMETEVHFFGMTHAEIGAVICRQWSFPVEVTQSVLQHHAAIPILRIMQDLPEIAKSVHAACLLADASDETLASDPPPGFEPEFLEFHKITPDLLQSATPKVRQLSDDMIKMLF